MTKEMQETESLGLGAGAVWMVVGGLARMVLASAI